MRFLLLSGFLFAHLYASPALAQGGDAKDPSAKEKPRKNVYTFYGLRKLEQDPKVADEVKLKEWQEFIERSKQHAAYAKKAVVKWKNAARIRVVEAASKSDRDPTLSPREKGDRWLEVARLYPKTKDGRRAKKRAVYWTTQETKRLVEGAEEVERARRPKVELIRAWVRVAEWVHGKGSEGRAATRRINELQKQLYVEAESVDRIARVDKQTKLEAWRDVLNARPTKVQRKKAERRIADLEAELSDKPRHADSK